MIVVDHALIVVALGAAALGTVCGALGTFAVLRRQSLLGDAMAHATLPGLCAAFLVAGGHPIVLALGAGIAGWIGTALVMAVVGTTRIKADSALGILLAVFFAVGLVLLGWIQRSGRHEAFPKDIFFGQAAAMREADVMVTIVVGTIVLGVLAVFWKEFKLLTFDPQYGQCLGIPMRRIETLLTTAIVAAIVIGLQMVGVVLMSAMLVAPAVAARQWTDRLGPMVILASIFGATAGIAGPTISASVDRLPAGPTIVLCASAIAVVSLVIAPLHGMAGKMWRAQLQHRQFRLELTLLALASPNAHSIIGRRPDKRRCRHLQTKGWAQLGPTGQWTLTPTGKAEVAQITARRIQAVLPAAHAADASGRFLVVAATETTK